MHTNLKASKIRKNFYNPTHIEVLKEIDLTLLRGETVAITGRSGQGKSTLLHVLGTLENPCSGTLEIANQKVGSFNRSQIRNKHVAFIFQSFHLLEDYSALDNVLVPARIARQSVTKGSPAYKKAWNLLERVGLSERAHFDTKLLSGGEKQRVAIARALCNDPDIILGDEPSGNLDRDTATVIHELLLSFAKREGKSVLIVTHDHSLAARCDKQYELADGKLKVV